MPDDEDRERDILRRLTTIKNRLRRKLRVEGVPEEELEEICAREPDAEDDE